MNEDAVWKRIEALRSTRELTLAVVRDIDKAIAEDMKNITPCTTCKRKVQSPCNGYFHEGVWDSFCKEWK